jgi:phosphotransferase system HPr (HPr) family protein
MKPSPAIVSPPAASLTEKVQLVNKFGLHLRASAKLSQLASQFESSIQIRKGDQVVNAKSVLNMIALAVHENRELEIWVEGADADKAMKAVRGLILDKFGERE